ncbi:hypothetical protein ACF1A5_13300 [Streptomyces sp. NPDC014864]|uniref:hypothetical protein n=1 Tax=Streptomyces sp. NPDC014864 TaxID=3364924 RepID=UPI0036FA4526
MASPAPAPAPRPAPASAPAPDGARAWRERAGLALRDRMPLWLQARCGLERGNVVALTALLVLAAVLAAQHFWTGRTESVRADPGELHLMQTRALVAGLELREVYRLAA